MVMFNLLGQSFKPCLLQGKPSCAFFLVWRVLRWEIWDALLALFTTVYWLGIEYRSWLLEDWEPGKTQESWFLEHLTRSTSINLTSAEVAGDRKRKKNNWFSLASKVLDWCCSLSKLAPTGSSCNGIPYACTSSVPNIQKNSYLESLQTNVLTVVDRNLNSARLLFTSSQPGLRRTSWLMSCSCAGDFRSEGYILQVGI